MLPVIFLRLDVSSWKTDYFRCVDSFIAGIKSFIPIKVVVCLSSSFILCRRAEETIRFPQSSGISKVTSLGIESAFTSLAMDREVWSGRSLLLITVALKMVSLTVAAPADSLIPSLPGQPEVDFKQYGGYITVDESHGRNLFYYFVEAENATATTPLVLWLNGGPGCSSLIGSFQELGPFKPNETGDGLVANTYSWNNVANVIFLESPAGVGFSYSNNTSDYNTNDTNTAKDTLAFLLGWLAEYPEYNSTDFYISGESYAGHYVPQLASAILQNNNVSGQLKIQLKGIMFGNPVLDNVIDLIYGEIEYAWGHGMVSEATHDTILNECNFSAPLSQACTDALSTAFNQSTSPYIDQYNVVADVCLSDGAGETLTTIRNTLRLNAMVFQRSLFKPISAFVPSQNLTFQQYQGESLPADPCLPDYVNTYLNLKAVQTALHAKTTQWMECSDVVNYEQSSVSMIPLVTDLINSTNLRIWIYSGDQDDVVPLIGTRKIINGVAENLNLTITSDYHIWFQGFQIGGWSISWGSLAYSTVRGAGHMVPYDQPARALALFSSFLAGNSTLPQNPY